MRTTADIPDPTCRKLKARAAQQGCLVKALILRGVERGLRISGSAFGRTAEVNGSAGTSPL